MLLAWSMRASDDFAAQIRALPRLYGLMQESSLFKRPVSSEEQDFQSLLMQREAATGMLTRFTDDLARISSGFADKSPLLSDALIAATMGYYYAKRGSTNGDSGHASTAVTGALQFDLNPLQQGLAGGGGLKALAMLEAMVDLLSGAGDGYRAVSGRERLTISNGAALTYSDADDKDDLIVGATKGDTIAGGGGSDALVGAEGNDHLNGGGSYDTLFGGPGDDTLIGGAGSDFLLGGDGVDTYVFEPGHLDDTIVDADGKGRILLGTDTDAPQLTGDAGFVLVPLTFSASAATAGTALFSDGLDLDLGPVVASLLNELDQANGDVPAPDDSDFSTIPEATEAAEGAAEASAIGDDRWSAATAASDVRRFDAQRPGGMSEFGLAWRESIPVDGEDSGEFLGSGEQFGELAEQEGILSLSMLGSALPRGEFLAPAML